MLLETKPMKGIIICLISYFFFSLVGLFEKSITESINIGVILFFQNFVCFLFILIPFTTRRSFSLKVNQINAYAVRIASGIGCYAVLFYIIRFIPISEALLYQYTGVLWIPFIMLVWLNARIHKNLWYGIILGFIGISFILRPGNVHLNSVALLGIFCGILQGLSVVSVRKLSATEPTLRILFYYFLIGTLVTMPFALEHMTAIGLKDAALLFAIGACTYFAQRLFTISAKYADPAMLGPISYTSILYAGIIGWLIWGEMPRNSSLIGMALVVTGCLATIWISKKITQVETSQLISNENTSALSS